MKLSKTFWRRRRVLLSSASTFRDSKRAPYHWRDELTFKEVKDIQEKCTLAMKLWGYKKANTQKQLKKLKPLLNYTL